VAYDPLFTAVPNAEYPGLADADDINLDSLLDTISGSVRSSENNFLTDCWSGPQFSMRGNCQIGGVDVFNTYAPIVLWTMVRLLLILLVVLSLMSKQVD
jgi:hypothetical protein